MPFRFRKSFKILPGIKINLSKSGLSTSFGGKGASVNVGKQGVRSTIGAPGTGMSFSTLASAPSKKGKTNSSSFQSPDQPDAPEDYLPSSSVIEKKKPKIKIPFSCLIPVALILMCWQIFFCSAAISGIINPQPTATPSPIATPSPLATPTQPSTSTLPPTQTLTFTPPPTQTPLPTIPLTPPTHLPTATTFISRLPANNPTLEPAVQDNSGYCCKYCGASSKACGDSCISLNKNCHKPPGCACD